MSKILLLVLAAATLDSRAGRVDPAVTDPFLGRWALNVPRSKYPPGECPSRMVIEMKAAGRGIHYVSETTFSNGRSAHAEYTANYDGRPVVVTGNHGILLPVSLERRARELVVASYTRAMQVLATSTRVVSKDGRMMTITTTSRDRAGKTVTNVGVYDKTREARTPPAAARRGRAAQV